MVAMPLRAKPTRLGLASLLFSPLPLASLLSIELLVSPAGTYEQLAGGLGRRRKLPPNATAKHTAPKAGRSGTFDVATCFPVLG